jgi:hypothetical protein
MKCLTVVILSVILVVSGGMAPAARGAQEPAPDAVAAEAVTGAMPLEPLSQLGGYPGPIAVVEPYAYVGSGYALVILNVSAPSRPWHVGSLPLPGVVRGITIEGSYAYIAAGEAGLRIVDIADPAAPIEVGSLTTNAVGDIVISRDAATNQAYAYVAEDTGLRIVDITNPQAPAAVGFCESGFIRAIAVLGRYVYVWSGYHHPEGTGTFSVLDVANPQQPQLAKVVPFFDGYVGYMTDMVVRGNYLYVVGLMDIYMYYYSTFLAVFDITNPAAPALLESDEGSWLSFSDDVDPDSDAPALLGSDATPMLDNAASTLTDRSPLGDAALALADHYAYISTGSVVDIADPANPTYVGRFKSGTDIAATQAYVYARGESEALSIFNRSDPANLVLAGSYAMPSSTRDVAAAGYHASTIDGRLRVIDAAKPDTPTTLGSYRSGQPHRLAITEQYAYLAWGYYVINKYSDNRSVGGLDIVDITNPRAPTQAGAITLVDIPYGPHADPKAMAVAAPYAYVGIDNAVHIVDVANPAAPSAVGFYTVPSVVEALALVELDSPAPRRYAYVAANEAGLRIVDVTDPNAPTEVKSYPIAGHHVTSVAVARPLALPDRQYAYLGTQLGRFQVLDVTNPAAPVVLGGFDFPAEAAIHDIAVHGGTAYLATETGLAVVDIADPAPPTLVDVAATPKPALSVAVMGNRVYVAAGDAGLFTFRHGAMIAGRVASRYGTTFPGVALAVDNGLTATPDATGFYATPALAAGSYTLTPSLPGYAFWPSSRTLIVPPDARWQGFTVIPAPVTFAFTPGLAATLTVTDTQDLTMEVTFPENALAQNMTMVLTPTLTTGGLGMAFTGHAFELMAYHDAAPQGDLAFDAPVGVTIRYSDADVGVVIDEQELMLTRWQTDENVWVDAAATCDPAADYSRDVAANTISVTICQPGRYALFGATNQLLIPIIVQDEAP